jgi:hypothetical protein
VPKTVQAFGLQQPSSRLTRWLKDCLKIKNYHCYSKRQHRTLADALECKKIINQAWKSTTSEPVMNKDKNQVLNTDLNLSFLVAKMPKQTRKIRTYYSEVPPNLKKL